MARRNTLALVTPTERADYHLATPLLATPGEALGESIDLIVVATGKREQLSDEFFQPSGAAGKTDRSSGEQGERLTVTVVPTGYLWRRCSWNASPNSAGHFRLTDSPS